MPLTGQKGVKSGESQNNSAGFWGICDFWKGRRGKRGLKRGWNIKDKDHILSSVHDHLYFLSRQNLQTQA
jgi:hypothetical protein